MKTYVLGDPHGGFKALKQCLKRCKFNYKKDTLICLGDIVDGWTESKQCVDELLKIKNLILVIGNHDCVDVKTELLTKDGWKKYTEINKKDTIYSFNTEKNVGEWTKINNMIIKKYKGEMIKIQNQHIDMLVTPSHRILCSLPTKDSYDYTFAKNFKYMRKIPVSSHSNKKEYFIEDEKIELVAWFLTDGHIQRLKKNHTGNYCIYQSKEQTYKRIIKTLKKLNYSFNVYTKLREIKYICGKKLKKDSYLSRTIRLYKDSARDIKKYIESKQNFPKWIYNLNNRQFGVFLNIVKLADGSIAKNNETFCLNGEKNFLEKIQTLCHLNNYRAVLVKDNRKTIRLNISKYTSSIISKKTISKVKYDNNVWCLNTPNGNFMVRRNGKIHFTGNCFMLDYILFKKIINGWYHQGGYNTLKSYGLKQDYQKHHRWYTTYQERTTISDEGVKIPKSHIELFKKAVPYYVDKKNRIYVHGGFIPSKDIKKQLWETLTWDRELLEHARCLEHTPTIPEDKKRIKSKYDEIFIGHTSTWRWSHVPCKFANVWCMDQGGGWEGKLSIMNVDTKEYFQSDIVNTLYSEEEGR